MRSQDHATASGAVTSGQPTLWCCHVKGPDDVYAAGSKDEAEAWARLVNSWGLDLAQAEAAPWPWCAESHALAVPRNREGFAPSSAKPDLGDSSRDTSTLPPQASEGTP